MDSFEVAVLRILVKRHTPIKLAKLVSGFPDNYEDNVLAAVSSLKSYGYIVVLDYQPNGDVFLKEEKRRDVLRVVESDILSVRSDSEPIVRKVEHSSAREIVISANSKRRNRFSPRTMGIVAASIFIVGFFSTLGFSSPTASTDTGSLGYSHTEFREHWNAYRFVYTDGGTSPSASMLAATTNHVPATSYFIWLHCVKSNVTGQASGSITQQSSD